MLDERYQGMGVFGGQQAKQRWDANIQWYEFKPGVWNQIRLYGPIYMVAQNWFTTTKGKKFALFSRAWDSFTRDFSKKDQDPIFQFFGNPYDHTSEQVKSIAPRIQAFAQAFIRPTPGMAQGGELKPLRIPNSVISGIRKVAQLNFATDPATGQAIFDHTGQPLVAEPTDPDNGCDLMIYYDPTRNGSEKYSVQMGSKSRLTDVERGSAIQLIDWHNIIQIPTENEVKEALSRNGYMSHAGGAGGVVAPENNFGAYAEVPSIPTMPAAPQAPAPVAPMTMQQFPTPPAAPAPAAPQMPQMPMAPAAPQMPQMPMAPAAPQMPQMPQAPAAPQMPQMPQAPAAPQMPQMPMAPQVPQGKP